MEEIRPDNDLFLESSQEMHDNPKIFSNVFASDLFVDETEHSYRLISMPHMQNAYKGRCKNRKTRYRHYHQLHPSVHERQLRMIANSGSLEKLTDFLEAVPEVEKIINSSDIKQRTALHMAASRGSDNVVHLLLQHGANPNLQDLNGNTPLHLAACTHHIRVITLLLQFGANVKATDSFGKTPLHLSLSRLKMLQARDQKKVCKDSTYETSKRKAEVGEIVAMLREYFDKSGQQDEHNKMIEITEKLHKAQTEDEVAGIGSLLSTFTQMTIDAAAKSKMSEE